MKPILKNKLQLIPYIIVISIIIFHTGKTSLPLVVKIISIISIILIFFDIYNPPKENRIKILYRIKTFLYGDNKNE